MAKKSRVGRPAMPEEEQQVLVPVRFPPDLLRRLDEQRSSRGDRPSRSALIREYIDAMLIAAERKR